MRDKNKSKGLEIMIKVRITKNNITRDYHLEDKTAQYYNLSGELKGTFEIENELEGLKTVINSNIGCIVEIL